jgi:Transposase DDE domain
VRLILIGGQVADVTQGAALVTGIEADHVIVDKGYDSNERVGMIEASGCEAVIPPRSNRNEKRDYDRHLYKDRNLNSYSHQGKRIKQRPSPCRLSLQP